MRVRAAFYDQFEVGNSSNVVRTFRLREVVRTFRFAI